MVKALRACLVMLVLMALPAPAWAAAAPNTPTITEPAADGEIVSAADVHMETAPFQDSDGGLHRCTDWEIWASDGTQRVWSALCVSDVMLRIHIHLGDGTFEASHAGRTSLLPNTEYEMRVRHSDETEWSAYAVRRFRTDVERQALPGAPEWTVELGYVVEEVASGFQLPVNVVPCRHTRVPPPPRCSTSPSYTAGSR